MRVSSAVAAAATLTLALHLGSARARAGDTRDFTLVNNTGQTITALWFSVHGMAKWEGTSSFKYVRPGGSTNIDFESQGPCVVQVRIDMGDGSQHEWRDGVDLCSVRRITVLNEGGSYLLHTD